MRLPALLEELLLVCSFPAYIFCDEEVFGISGESFTFPVKSDKKITEVIWTKNKDKVAEWEGQGEPVYFTSLQERGLLDKGSGSLTIFNLENTDTGTYVLECIFSDGKNDVLTFTLAVLAPPSEPQISCNISGDNLVLTCAADFKKPLNYSWKISGIPTTAWDQEVLIPKEKVDAVEKAACFIKYSQIEKSSEITLDQCIPSYQGQSYQKRNKSGLIVAIVAVFGIALIILYLYKRERTKRGTGGADQRDATGGDHLLEQPNTALEDEQNEVVCGNTGIDDTAASSQTSAFENERPEADKEWNGDSGMKDKPVNHGVSQKELSNKEKSTVTSTSGVVYDETAGGSGRECQDIVEPGVAQGEEDEKCEHLSNCSPKNESES